MHKTIKKQRYNPNHKGSKTLFSNRLLERLTRTHIAVPITLLLIYALSILLWACLRTNTSALQISVLYLGGLTFFTLVEYLLHRFLYHMKTNTDNKRKIQYNMHGVHHEFPKDKDRLAMPPLLSISLSTLILYLFHSVLGEYSFGFFSGFITGYALYLFMHYILHIHKAPKNIFKKLWAYHSIHHYKDETVYFGVSTPIWDFVFGQGIKTRVGRFLVEI